VTGTSTAPGWLMARPIAHRGLHDRARGIIENSQAAALAAVAGGCSIECDVQVSRDGEAFVFHDEDLARLTGDAGAFHDRDACEIAKLRLSGAQGDASLLTLSDFLTLVAARTPVIVEIKSAFRDDMRLAERTAEIVAAYRGPVALKSFDAAIIAHLRHRRAALTLQSVPLGIVAQASYEHSEWNMLNPQRKHALANLLHWRETQPEFLSYCVDDLPHAVPHLLRSALGAPVMAWTVRTPAQWSRARAWADQAVFEGSHPAC
jgi:glycerophosphoryl diester phosphodiesterase